MNETKLKKLLGLRIKQFRNKLGLTQEELGEKIDRSQRQVSLIELGSSFPNPITLTNISKALNCSMKDLFDFEPVDSIANLKEELFDLIETSSEEKLKTIYIIAKNL